mmetsp:Transcript_120768/g.352738  ORF Transcript_120768/g.352738 Transcript_120768/m.352738 type:complete len:333 (-) Transcript_120768:14-1012(-)
MTRRVIRNKRRAFNRDYISMMERVEIELLLKSLVELPGALDEPVVSNQLLLCPLGRIPTQYSPYLCFFIWPFNHTFRWRNSNLLHDVRLVPRRSILMLEVRKKSTFLYNLIGGEEVVRVGQLADRRVHAIAFQQAHQTSVVVVVHVRDQDLLQSFDAVGLHTLIQGLHELFVPKVLLTRVNQDAMLARAYQVAASPIQREGGRVERQHADHIGAQLLPSRLCRCNLPNLESLHALCYNIPPSSCRPYELVLFLRTPTAFCRLKAVLLRVWVRISNVIAAAAWCAREAGCTPTAARLLISRPADPAEGKAVKGIYVAIAGTTAGGKAHRGWAA